MVQLPEPLDPESKEQKLASECCDKLGKPRTIAELTKERLRRAGKKIKEENPLFVGDLGFRVFKLDSTNIREWDPNRESLAESLEASVEHLKSDRTPSRTSSSNCCSSSASSFACRLKPRPLIRR